MDPLLGTDERDLLSLQESQEEEEEEEERGEPEGKGRGNDESNLSSPSPESRPDNVVKVSIPTLSLSPSNYISIFLSICLLICLILLNLLLRLNLPYFSGGCWRGGWCWDTSHLLPTLPAIPQLRRHGTQ